MDFNELRMIQQEERNSEYISRVDENLYDDMKKLKEEATDDIYMIRSITTCISNIIALRYHKIIKNAATSCISDKPVIKSHFTKKEEQLYNSCVELFNKYLEAVE